MQIKLTTIQTDFAGSVKGIRNNQRNRVATILVALLVMWPGISVGQSAGGIFEDVNVQYLGTSIGDNVGRGGWLYDFQPTILFEPEDPPRKFKMWWTGQYRPGDTDLPPNNLDAGDRIYFSSSTDGTVWSTPRAVLKGQGGRGGYDAADDHLIGSPSVIKVDGKYYMFYEAYGTWSTAITRFFSVARGDTWCANGQVQDAYSPDYPCRGSANVPDWQPGYVLEKTLGFAPMLRKHGTHPVYAGEVTYLTVGNGKANRYLQLARPRNDCTSTERWRPLNNGQPVFWLYDGQGEGGRRKLYSCFDPVHSNSFTSDQRDCEGHGLLVEELGYAARTATGRDMAGSNQNRICLASSPDGINWTRILGDARGGAMLAPLNELTNTYPHACGDENPNERYDIHRTYGSGYPCAIVRGSSLELHFSDDSLTDMNICVRPPLAWRIRFPLSQIESGAAYLAAERQPNATYMGDMKWSPMFKRYFALGINSDPNYDPCRADRIASPRLFWSNYNPNPRHPPTFSDARSFAYHFPTNGEGTNRGRIATWGGLLGTALGQTVDFADPMHRPVYSALHLFYGAQSTSMCDSVFHHDLDHTLVFLWPQDADDDGIPDWSDNCPTVSNRNQSDVDGDEVGDACDPCTDTDHDDCGDPGFIANTCPVDECLDDRLKCAPGQCGCGLADDDDDRDGTANCIDGCPNDGDKIAPGLCGCNRPEIDHPADLDSDCDADLDDFARFSFCIADPLGDCPLSSLDSYPGVDLADVAIFQNAMGWPAEP